MKQMPRTHLTDTLPSIIDRLKNRDMQLRVVERETFMPSPFTVVTSASLTL